MTLTSNEPNPEVMQKFTDLNTPMHQAMKEERRIFFLIREREEADLSALKAKKKKLIPTHCL